MLSHLESATTLATRILQKMKKVVEIEAKTLQFGSDLRLLELWRKIL